MEQYADTTDPFVNIIYKKLRNKKKKLDKIAQTEQKVKSKEIIPNAEQTEMLNSKGAIKEEKQIP